MSPFFVRFDFPLLRVLIATTAINLLFAIKLRYIYKCTPSDWWAEIN